MIVPVYDEEEVLLTLFARMYSTLDKLACRYEVIFIDDGSRDKSPCLLRDQIQRRPDVTRVIYFNGNFGQHMDLMAGFEHSRGVTHALTSSLRQGGRRTHPTRRGAAGR